MKNIAIVIPVHNRIKFTKDCLYSLRKQTYKDFQTVIIDDGSSDGTALMIKNDFPETKVINGDGNLYWTAATNLGVRYSLKINSKYIMTLNNDTIAEINFLEKMIYWAERKAKSLIGAFAIDYVTKKPIYGGEIINWRYGNNKNLLHILPKDKWYGLHEVTHFPGRGLLIPSKLFEQIGLFDEKCFPHYAADYDFTHRAIKVGYKVYCNYDAKLYIYPEMSGDAEYRKDKSIKNFYIHLFGIKGGGNLIVYTKYVIKNAPWYYKLFSLLIGYVKRIFGYWV